MIIKSYEINKIELNKFNFFLFYGKNEGAQTEIINQYFMSNFNGKVSKYDENEFINNYEVIASEILTKSLFEDEKIIIISRTTGAYISSFLVLLFSPVLSIFKE